MRNEIWELSFELGANQTGHSQIKLKHIVVLNLIVLKKDNIFFFIYKIEILLYPNLTVYVCETPS